LRSARRVVLTIIGCVLLAVGVSVFSLRAYLGREAESHLAQDEAIDFGARGSAGRSNVFAMCPSGYCTPPADMASPVFAMGWERLREYWHEMIAVQPDIEPVGWDVRRRRATYIQRSEIFRFPDVITVEFLELDDGRSSLAIDSRSRYGRGDLGANRRRVIAWVTMLQKMMRQDQRPAG
jgi:uncharacterized protein (DUF1499 family)